MKFTAYGDNDTEIDSKKILDEMMKTKPIDSFIFVGDGPRDLGNCLICNSKKLEEINNHYLKCHNCGKVWDLRKKELLQDVEREMIDRGMELE